ncbi:hypothetical protein BLA18110_04457 [Burkholderia lata]|nr:hypothetical protein BLA18110_04457 [Burkholderia lata]
MGQSCLRAGEFVRIKSAEPGRSIVLWEGRYFHEWVVSGMTTWQGMPRRGVPLNPRTSTQRAVQALRLCAQTASDRRRAAKDHIPTAPESSVRRSTCEASHRSRHHTEAGITPKQASHRSRHHTEAGVTPKQASHRSRRHTEAGVTPKRRNVRIHCAADLETPHPAHARFMRINQSTYEAPARTFCDPKRPIVLIWRGDIYSPPRDRVPSTFMRINLPTP